MLYVKGREVWRVDLWRDQDSLLPFTSLAGFPIFHRPALSVKKTCWYPKVCVYGAWNGSSGCGCLCEVVGDWDVNQVVNYPIHNGDSGLRSKKALVLVHRSLPDTVVCGSHATLRVFNDGSFLHRCWCSAQVMLEESTGFGFLNLLLGGHVETTMCVYGEIRQCTWQCKLLLECDR